MTPIFLNVLETSLTLSIVAALALPFCRIAGKGFTAKCRYAVWLIIAVRLCIPLNVLPVAPLFRLTLPSAVTAEETDGLKESGNVSPDAAPVLKEDADNGAPSSEGGTVGAESAVITEAPSVKEDVESTPVHGESRKDTEQITFTVALILKELSALWLAGVAVFLGVKLASHASYSHTVRRRGTLFPPDELTGRLYEKAASDMGLRRAPKLWVSSAVASPMLIGYIRPIVIIPKHEFDAEVLQMILRHELVHYARGDLYVKLLCAVAESLHWFNPIIHAVADKCISEMELSCDETALKGLDEGRRVSYCEALMSIARIQKSRDLLTTGFGSKEGALKERIISITDSGKKRKGTAFAALILVLCITSGAFVGYKSEAADVKTEAESTAETERSEAENAADGENATENVTDGHGHAEETPPAPDTEDGAGVPADSDCESGTAEVPDADNAVLSEESAEETDGPAERPVEEAPPAETVRTHSYAVSGKAEATCTEAGSITYACVLCGDAYTETIPAAGHGMTGADCTSPSVCRICGATEGTPLGHDFSEATFTTPMTCKLCGATEGDVLPPLSVDVVSFKNDTGYSLPTAIPQDKELSVYVKDAYYDLKEDYVHRAEMLSAVRIDDLSYSLDGISEASDYNVSFNCIGEVILDETDLDTAYICLVVLDKQTNSETEFKLPYTDFSKGSKVSFSLSTQLKSGDYRVYFKNQGVFIADND